jgi:hypothetical protein
MILHKALKVYCNEWPAAACNSTAQYGLLVRAVSIYLNAANCSSTWLANSNMLDHTGGYCSSSTSLALHAIGVSISC